MADGRALDPALVVTVPPTRLPERRYVLDTVLGEFLGIPFRLEIGSPGTTSIALAAVPNDARIVMPDRLLALDESVWLTEDSLRSLQLQETKVADTPVLAMFPGDAPAARSSEWLPFDLLGAIFFCLTRYEEYVTG